MKRVSLLALSAVLVISLTSAYAGDKHSKSPREASKKEAAAKEQARKEAIREAKEAAQRERDAFGGHFPGEVVKLPNGKTIAY